MRKKYWILGALLLFTVGCCEQCCPTVDPTECNSLDDVDLPPGPIIVVDPNTSTNLFEWRFGGAAGPVQTARGTSVFPDCALRDDFIGIGYVQFWVETSGSPVNPAKKIQLVAPDGSFRLTINRPKFGGFQWLAEEIDTATHSITQSCSLEPSGADDTTHVPDEFVNLDVGKLKELVAPADGVSATLQVKMP